MKPPASFTQVEGWRESFDAARQRLEDTRTVSLFAEIRHDLCGETVRAFTLRDWSIMRDAKNPIIVGGEVLIEHAVSALWILRADHLKAGNGRWSRFLRSMKMARVVWRHRNNKQAIIDAVCDFIDDAFIDLPGRFNPNTSKAVAFNPSTAERTVFEVSLSAEIMRAFPSFSFESLRTMPLAQFWQFLHEARIKENPDYRSPQLSDLVNRNAVRHLNQLRRESKAS